MIFFMVAYLLYLLCIVLIFIALIRAHTRWELRTATKQYRQIIDTARAHYLRPAQVNNTDQWLVKHASRLENQREAILSADGNSSPHLAILTP